jgi:hypothetical protein
VLRKHRLHLRKTHGTSRVKRAKSSEPRQATQTAAATGEQPGTLGMEGEQLSTLMKRRIRGAHLVEVKRCLAGQVHIQHRHRDQVGVLLSWHGKIKSWHGRHGIACTAISVLGTEYRSCAKFYCMQVCGLDTVSCSCNVKSDQADSSYLHHNR